MSASPSACRARYQGDETLARLLEKSGSAYGVDGVKALIAGVMGAPPARPNDAWHVLVADDPSPALKAQLDALKDAMADSRAEVPARARVSMLRAELARRGLAGFLVPRTDEYQNEFIPPAAERLEWLSGFTGSAGVAAVLVDKAAIFVDGRYTLQVRNQVDTAVFEPRHVSEQPLADWLAEHLPKESRLGFDPWLHTSADMDRLEASCARAGARLVALDDNPIDAVWHARPRPPIAPVVPHDVRHAGRAHAEKLRALADDLAKRELAAAVITATDSVAWLFNVRGGDLPHTPAPLAAAVVRADGAATIFVDARKLTPRTRAHLGNQVRIEAPDALGAALGAFKGQRVLADPSSVPAYVVRRLKEAGAEIAREADPCQLPKARKTAAELDGTRAAHRRDGAALARFLAWLEREAAKGQLTELAASDRLAEFRAGGENFRDLSFDTIAGAGPNGAIVHYRVTAESDRRLEPGSLFLLDSGAQYLDGTTDVTRTVFVRGGASATAEHRDRFTRVLKGHIALARARFPKGTTGSQLDSLARRALWEAGLDYDHGTGHGVGSYLGVHEGPQRIAKMPNTIALEPGMIVSNEPGYYKTGEYGIRIENLIAVAAVDGPSGAERPLLGFETLTLAPIDGALIEPALLDVDERAWLDAYHGRVRETLSPLVDETTRAWLAAATRPIGV
jgi:Xaa-Pro aminopeptidase